MSPSKQELAFPDPTGNLDSILMKGCSHDDRLKLRSFILEGLVCLLLLLFFIAKWINNISYFFSICHFIAVESFDQ